MVFDLLSILAVVVWLVGLGAAGYLTAPQIAIALAGLVVLRAIGRALGLRWVRFMFTVCIPIASLLVFLSMYSGASRDAIVALVSQMLVLLIILGALYWMIVGAFGKRR